MDYQPSNSIPTWLNRTLQFIDSVQENERRTTEVRHCQVSEFSIPEFIVIGHPTNPTMSSQQPAAGAPAPTPCGQRSGTMNFSKEETMHLLNLPREALPIGQEEWEIVVKGHRKGGGQT